MEFEPREDTWLQHRLRQAPWRSQAQGTSLVLVTVILVVVIGALYLAQASRTAAAGRRLQGLEADRQRLEQQNAQLRAEIAALRSVPRLIRDAQALGYHPARANEVDYVPVAGIAPPPEIPIIAPPDEPAEESAPAYDETLETFLSDQLSSFREGLTTFFQATFAGQSQPSTPTSTPVP